MVLFTTLQADCYSQGMGKTKTKKSHPLAVFEYWFLGIGLWGFIVLYSIVVMYRLVFSLFSPLSFPLPQLVIVVFAGYALWLLSQRNQPRHVVFRVVEYAIALIGLGVLTWVLSNITADLLTTGSCVGLGGSSENCVATAFFGATFLEVSYSSWVLGISLVCLLAGTVQYVYQKNSTAK